MHVVSFFRNVLFSLDFFLGFLVLGSFNELLVEFFCKIVCGLLTDLESTLDFGYDIGLFLGKADFLSL